ncbi:hypothetical protein SNE40_006896 [Patella caerulea]
MKPEHLEIWTELQEFLINEFKNNPEELMRILFSQKIIDTDDKEMARKEKRENLNKGVATKLVEILCDRGDMVLPRIIKALKPTYGKVAKRLEKQLANLEGSNEENCSIPVQESGR